MQIKVCTTCKIAKNILEFYNDGSKKDGLSNSCKLCKIIQSNTYYKNNKQQILKKYKLQNKCYPWKRVFQNIKSRCNNNKSDRYRWYGLKGIKCLITEEELKYLWFRDMAYLMKKPSIDRIDNKGNYTLDNCQFIEHKENTGKETKKIIYQYDLNNNFIKKWESLTAAANTLKINRGHISNCATGKYKTSGGFIWKYYYE